MKRNLQSVERMPMGLGARRSAGWAGGAIAVVLLALIASQTVSTWQDLITMTLIWAALATAWNIVGGFAGQISLGHAAFFGTGAYVSTLLYVNFGISPWIGIIAAIAVSALLSLLVGIPAFRLQGPYFALATLAVGLIFYYLSIQLQGITRGEVGIPLPYEPSFSNMTFEDRPHYVLLAGGFLLLCIAVAQAITKSRLGYQLAAIRDDESAARALGVNTYRSKLIAAVISGGLTGGVGTIYSQYILFISPDSVLGVPISIEALVLAIVGGSTFVFGPLVGAIVLVPVSHLMLEQFGGSAPGLHTMIYSGVLIVVVLLFPGGLYGLIRTAVTRTRRLILNGNSEGKAVK